MPRTILRRTKTDHSNHGDQVTTITVQIDLGLSKPNNFSRLNGLSKLGKLDNVRKSSKLIKLSKLSKLSKVR